MFLVGNEGRQTSKTMITKEHSELPDRCTSILGAQEIFMNNLPRRKTKMSLMVEWSARRTTHTETQETSECVATGTRTRT